MVEIYDEILKSEASDILRNISDERLPKERDRRLRPIDGQWK
jgi:hypothetical protein